MIPVVFDKSLGGSKRGRSQPDIKQSTLEKGEKTVSLQQRKKKNGDRKTRKRGKKTSSLSLVKEVETSRKKRSVADGLAVEQVRKKMEKFDAP